MKNIIVVSGASSGMGRDFSIEISKKEKVDEIWVISRRIELLNKLQEEIDTKVVPISIDLGNRDEIIEKYYDRLKEEKPIIKVLGLFQGFGKFDHYENLSLKENIDMIEVNTISVVEMINYSLDYMDSPSNILIMCSGSSVQPVPYMTMYSATKTFLLTYSRSLNRELKYRKIHVMGVVPQWVQTPFFDTAIDEKKKPVVIKYGKIYKSYDVIKKAIKDLYTNKDVSYYGFGNIMQVLGVKLLPHKMVMNVWLKKQKLNGKRDIR